MAIAVLLQAVQQLVMLFTKFYKTFGLYGLYLSRTCYFSHQSLLCWSLHGYHNTLFIYVTIKNTQVCCLLACERNLFTKYSVNEQIDLFIKVCVISVALL